MRHRTSEIAITLAALALAGSATTVATAQTAIDPANVKVTDIALQPLTELNLRHATIAPILAAARSQPYALAQLDSCAKIAVEVAALDAVLGADIDTAEGKPTATRFANGAGRIARSMIMSFVPFHAVIREVSGASARQHDFDRALYAGSVRRAYLKGIGEERGCAYPARDATPEVALLVRAARHGGPALATALAAQAVGDPARAAPVLASASWAVPPP